MYPVGRLHRRLLWAAAVAFAAAAAISAQLLYLCRALPSVSEDDREPSVLPTWPDANLKDPADWSILTASSASTNERSSGPSSRLRLAGTFLQLSGGEGTNEVRKAILDDVAAGTQYIVSEGDDLGGLRVVGIYGDHVSMRGAAEGDFSLWLSFSRSQGAAGSVTNDAGDYAGGDGRFGLRQTGSNRWVFGRDPLMQYYKELMDQPERLVAVFDSLKPSYTPQGKIDGYRLNVEGEGEFFKAAGLREKDIVRSVNSLPMTSRRRAENFIKQFVTDNASAFVLEVERDGSVEKLIYEMR